MSNWTPKLVEVLIVDDSLAAREWTIHCLEESGKFRLSISDNASEALSIAQRRSFDVVLLDLSMPNVDGCAVIRGLRERCPEAVIVALVTESTRRESLSALRAGATTYLAKPMTAEKLRHTLESLYRRTRWDDQFIMDGAICSSAKPLPITSQIAGG